MRPTLKFAIQWIADNDNPGDDDDLDTVSGYISVLLVSDLFGKDPVDIATKVLTFRLLNREGVQ